MYLLSNTNRSRMVGVSVYVVTLTSYTVLLLFFLLVELLKT